MTARWVTGGVALVIGAVTDVIVEEAVTVSGLDGAYGVDNILGRAVLSLHRVDFQEIGRDLGLQQRRDVLQVFGGRRANTLITGIGNQDRVNHPPSRTLVFWHPYRYPH